MGKILSVAPFMGEIFLSIWQRGGSVGGRGQKIRDTAKGRRQANGREIFPMAGQSTSSWPSAKTLQSGKHDIPNKLGPSLGSHSQVRLFSAF